MPIAPVLQRFVDDELALAPALIERVLAGCLRLLRDSKDSPLSGFDRAHYFTLVEALHSRAANYQRAFTDALSNGVRAALAEQSDDLPADALPASGGLELMDESRVEIDIEISRAMQLIDTTAEWELRELQTFTSTLIGQTHVSTESNPLRPLVYAAALWEAASAVSPVQEQRTILLRVSAGVAAALLRKAWAAACTRLEAQGVELAIYRTVLLAPGSTLGRGDPAPADTAQLGELANLLASMPGSSTSFQVGAANAATAMGSRAPARSAASPVSGEFEQALARLDELLRHPAQAATGAMPNSDETLVKRVTLHRAALISSASAPQERQIIELLARLFDSILADPQVPAAFVTVLARLQTSALRVALHDPEMLSSTQHAVWRLLDRIGEVGTGHPQANDARTAALLKFCNAMAEQLACAPAPDATLYCRAQTQFDLFLKERLQTQLRAAKTSVQALQRAERRDILEQQLMRRLVDQMAPMRVTSPSIRHFVTSAWAKVLAESMLREGEQGDATRGYIKLVDELLWSVQLPDHPQSRQRLLSMLPSMLQRLRAGMALINLPAVEQSNVLDELMVIHTAALRPSGRAADPATPTSEQIVERIGDELLSPPARHGGFSDSVIDLGSMETVPAELMPESPADEPTKRIDALREADRLRLFLQGRWARVQLLWRSDQGLFFLFAGENAGHTHSVTHRALEKLSAAGLLQPLEARSLVQRALDNVTRELVRPG